jgi:glyoxylase-like metal-dependent hydrolase (beta-lactamase superfamily II)
MSKLKVNQYVVGPVQTNCYFAINDETKELLIIDPGDSAKQLAERVRTEGGKPVAILLTHGHFDHATAAEELAKEFDIKIYVHELERETLEDAQINVSWMVGASSVFHADEFLKDEQEMDLAGFHIRLMRRLFFLGTRFFVPRSDAATCRAEVLPN